MRFLLFARFPGQLEKLVDSFDTRQAAETAASLYSRYSPRIATSTGAEKLLGAVRTAAPKGKNQTDDAVPSYGGRRDGLPFGSDPLPAAPPPVNPATLDAERPDVRYLSDNDLARESVDHACSIVVVEARLAEIRLDSDGFYLTLADQQRAEFLRARAIRLRSRIEAVEAERERRREERATSAAKKNQLRRAGVK